MHRHSLVEESRSYSRCGAQASHCGGFSCCRARALGCRGFSRCGTRAWLFCVMRDLPGPGSEPMSPALAGRFLTTGPPGKFGNSNFSVTLLELPRCCSLWLYHFMFPPVAYQSSSFSTSWPALVNFCCFDNSCVNGCEVAFHGGFNFHFPNVE